MLNVECYHAVTYQIPRDYYYFLHFTHITFYIFKFYHRKHRVVTALHTFTMQLQQRTVPSNQQRKTSCSIRLQQQTLSPHISTEQAFD